MAFWVCNQACQIQKIGLNRGIFHKLISTEITRNRDPKQKTDWLLAKCTLYTQLCVSPSFTFICLIFSHIRNHSPENKVFPVLPLFTSGLSCALKSMLMSVTMSCSPPTSPSTTSAWSLSRISPKSRWRVA